MFRCVKVSDCGNKLRRAEQLISGLGGEKTSWARFSSELQIKYENVTGEAHDGLFIRIIGLELVSVSLWYTESRTISPGDHSKQENECDLLGRPWPLFISDLQSQYTNYPSENVTLSSEIQRCEVLYYPNVVVMLKMSDAEDVNHKCLIIVLSGLSPCCGPRVSMWILILS